MTVSEAVINWLMEFDPVEYGKMRNIHTDIQPAEVDAYSLVKEPVQNIKTFISGKRVFTDHYMIRARLSSYEDFDRVENNGFGETLEDWVREQDRNKHFPKIEGADVKYVRTTTPFHVGKTENNNSLYQMTISIQYIKEVNGE